MIDPIITVVVPVFNDQDNIIRCLESLRYQTVSGIEVIVVNDASTDNTMNTLRRYQKEYQFSIIAMDKNSGAGSCRNTGILAAHAPYITFVDSDDWIDIHTYEKCREQFYEDPDIKNFGLIYDYVSCNRRTIKYRYDRKYKVSGEFALNIYAHTIPNEFEITPIVNNKIYRRQFLIDNHLFFHEELRYQEDDVFTFETLAKAGTVILIDDCFYHYCQRDDSLIHEVSEYAVHNFVSAYVALRESLKSDGLFEKYKQAYYLKFKGSLLGVLKRILDYSHNKEICNKLVALLMSLLHENFDMLKLLDTIDFSLVRSIL